MHDDRLNEITRSIERSAGLMRTLADQAERIEAIRGAAVETLANGGKLLTAGHGGSAADALHLAEELVGRFDKDRRALPAISLLADPTLMTCIANDFGFERVFPRQVEAHGRPGDLLVLLSTSGNGTHLRNTMDAAEAAGLTTVTLLGKGGGALAGRADHELIVPSDETARIQEAHTLVIHLMLEAVDARFAEPEPDQAAVRNRSTNG